MELSELCLNPLSFSLVVLTVLEEVLVLLLGCQGFNAAKLVHLPYEHDVVAVLDLLHALNEFFHGYVALLSVCLHAAELDHYDLGVVPHENLAPEVSHQRVAEELPACLAAIFSEHCDHLVALFEI